MNKVFVLLLVASHLLQMRGLKLYATNAFICKSVASFTDAWIETGMKLVVQTKV